MRPVAYVMLSLAVALPLQAQRRIRIGPTITAVSLQDATGSSHSFTAFGGTLAFLTGDDSELGLVVARYADLAADDCVRNLTFVALDSYFYPVGAGGIAPYAVTEVGLGRLRESFPAFGCGLLPNVQQSTQLGLAYGLGVRVSGGQWIAATVEGRFFQMPNSAIQSLEARAAVAATFGPRRKTDLGAGTLGPVISYLIPVAGPLRARAPFAGVRFRRDTQKRGTLGLQIDYAPLEITASCSARCAPFAILFAPGYEASAHASWGRFYGTAGIMLAGFPSAGDDRGMAQGLHGGIGADLFSGRLMTNVSARLLWIQRNSDENVFGVQVGVSLSPRLERPVAGALGH